MSEDASVTGIWTIAVPAYWMLIGRDNTSGISTHMPLQLVACSPHLPPSPHSSLFLQ